MCNEWAKELDSLFYDKKFDKEYTIDDYRMLQNNLIQYKVYKSKEAAEYIIKEFCLPSTPTNGGTRQFQSDLI